jgi:uncharacterized membrane protein YadS
MLFKKYLVIVPGIILAFVLYSFLKVLIILLVLNLLGYEKSPISTAMIAILLGMVFGNIFQMRTTCKRFRFYSIIYS